MTDRRKRMALAVACLASALVAAGVVGPRLGGGLVGGQSATGPAPAAHGATASGAPAEPAVPADPAVPLTKARPQIVSPAPDEARRSLQTLRQVDGHPLFTMDYYGPAPRVDQGSPTAEGASVDTQRRPFACTVFFAAGGRPVFGRNFDWDHNPALVLIANPTDAYRSLSVVDLSYLGITSAADMQDPAKREGLLRAVTLPFDGMNEHGLTIGMAAVDDVRPEVLPERAAVGSVGIMRQVLDHARTMDEAVEVIRSYNIDFDGGPGLHYLVADAAGSSAVVEFVDGRLRVVPGDGGWQVMENFPLTTVADRSGFPRYNAAAARLAGGGGALTPAESMALLGSVAQGHTQWSAVYDLSERSVRLAMGRDYDVVHEFRLR